jgi:hypothetical protein
MKGDTIWGSLDVDEMILLKWILKKQGVRLKTRIIVSEQGPAMGFCEHGNEPSGFIKGGARLGLWTGNQTVLDRTRQFISIIYKLIICM